MYLVSFLVALRTYQHHRTQALLENAELVSQIRHDRLLSHIFYFTVHCPMPSVHCSLSTGHCPLSNGHCPLSTVHWPLSTGHWPLCHWTICSVEDCQCWQKKPSLNTHTTTCTQTTQKCYFPTHPSIHSFRSLSDDRSTASSTASSPRSTI